MGRALRNELDEVEAASRLATPLFWAAGAGANVALIAGRELSDSLPALGIALVCEGAIYLTLWAYMRGVRWAALEPARAEGGVSPAHSQCQGSNG